MKYIDYITTGVYEGNKAEAGRERQKARLIIERRKRSWDVEERKRKRSGAKVGKRKEWSVKIWAPMHPIHRSCVNVYISRLKHKAKKIKIKNCKTAKQITKEIKVKREKYQENETRERGFSSIQ